VKKVGALKVPVLKMYNPPQGPPPAPPAEGATQAEGGAAAQVPLHTGNVGAEQLGMRGPLTSPHVTSPGGCDHQS
jgi:hypothetical protein